MSVVCDVAGCRGYVAWHIYLLEGALLLSGKEQRDAVNRLQNICVDRPKESIEEERLTGKVPKQNSVSLWLHDSCVFIVICPLNI